MPEQKLFHVVVRALVFNEEDRVRFAGRRHDANLDILVDAHSPEDATARVTRALTLLANKH
jgi:hypothetical protein